MSKTNLLTANEITNLYLYGRKENLSESEKIDDAILNREEITVNISKEEYMNGPGRFIKISDFELINRFFDDQIIIEHPELKVEYSPNLLLTPGHKYSKDEILKMLNESGMRVNDRSKNFVGFYDDGKDNLLERAYIWNTTGYKINDEALFCVTDSGERYITNFAIRPFDDNFDFEGSFISALANQGLGLENAIDPSGIGKRVNIRLTGDIVLKTVTYKDYKNSLDDNRLKISSAFEVANRLDELIERLWKQGSIRSLYKEKPIIYGS